MRHPLNFVFLCSAAALLLGTGTSSANFSTISTAVTSDQTLSSGTGTVTSTGSIIVNTSNPAVTMSGAGTALIVSGTIQQTDAAKGDRAVMADATSLTIQVNSSGLINAAVGDAVQSGNSNTSITLTNNGTISVNNGNGGQGVDWANITTGSNSLMNNGRILDTGEDAVRPGVNGIIVNTGTISATYTGSGSDGIDATANAGVNITNSGLIQGRHGITGGVTTGGGAYTMTVTNQAGGTLMGVNGSGINIDGINGNELVTVVNNGTIIGDGTTQNTGGGGGDGDGVDVDGLINLTNTGTIKSLNSLSSGSITNVSEGVTVGGGVIVNSGTIEGENTAGATGGPGRGITLAGIDTTGTQAALYGATSVSNTGLIKGDSDSGIAIAQAVSGFSITISNSNGGIIEGSGTNAAINTGGDGVTINNSATIKEDAAGVNAITLGGGTNALNVTGGAASIVGNIAGAVSGSNTMTIAPGSGNTFSYAGGISNFNTVAVESGTVSFSGSSSYTGVTRIDGGTLQIVNDGVTANGKLAATASIAINGGGTLLFSGSNGVNGRINSTASVALNGGKLSFGSLSNTFEAAGALTLSPNSTIDFGPGSGNTLTFSSLPLSSGSTPSLSVTGWTGSPYGSSVSTDTGSASQDRLLFLTNPSLTAAQLSNISFYNDANQFIGSGKEVAYNSEFEIVAAVPEPATVVGAAALLVLVALRERKRLRALRARLGGL